MVISSINWTPAQSYRKQTHTKNLICKLCIWEGIDDYSYGQLVKLAKRPIFFFLQRLLLLCCRNASFRQSSVQVMPQIFWKFRWNLYWEYCWEMTHLTRKLCLITYLFLIFIWYCSKKIIVFNYLHINYVKTIISLALFTKVE